jgi:2-C-methyl-D-erythritol 2,4-cyclodiphosphate synthase
MRIGIGHDTHRIASGGTLRLGGVEIESGRHLVGHSDADVLLHAITDALLGAAALGDLGDLFPDTDPALRGRDSGELMQSVAAQITAAGFRIINIDCIVFAQEPKLGPLKLKIRQRVAALLQLTPAQVAVKAKTGEGVGEVGRGEVIMAQAVVLIESHKTC